MLLLKIIVLLILGFEEVKTFYLRNININRIKRSDAATTDPEVLRYLERYGYLEKCTDPNDPICASMKTSDPFRVENAIAKFQEFFGIQKTAKSDEKTKIKMAEPRCGVPDIQEIVDLNYIPWKKENITYAIDADTLALENITTDEFRKVIREGFDIWSKNIPRNFIETDNFQEADIKISSSNQNNLDANETRDVGYANIKGILHFDTKQKWKHYKIGEKEVPDTVDILAVTVHEIGHILGLEHSNIQESNMQPTFHHFFGLKKLYIQPSLLLSDIQSIQLIYGERKN